jgi:tryptophan-rich sensory protein
VELAVYWSMLVGRQSTLALLLVRLLILFVFITLIFFLKKKHFAGLLQIPGILFVKRSIGSSSSYGMSKLCA